MNILSFPQDKTMLYSYNLIRQAYNSVIVNRRQGPPGKNNQSLTNRPVRESLILLGLRSRPTLPGT